MNTFKAKKIKRLPVDKYIHQLYTANMIRTQIYISETLHQRAQALAKSKKQSLANLYRNFIANGLKKETQTADLTSLAKLNLEAGPKDLSKNIDKYLYGKK